MDLVRATRARCAPEQHSPDAHGHGASVGHNGRNRGSFPGPRRSDGRSSACVKLRKRNHICLGVKANSLSLPLPQS